MAETLKINEIQLFNLLKPKLGEKEAESLVMYVKASVKDELNENLNVLATKEFVKDEVNILRGELKETKSEIIKWMFVFWVGNVISLAALIFALAKFMKV